MRLSIPALVFAAFLALAAIVLVTGGLLAERRTVERVERDRRPHEQLAAELKAELQRLEGRYEAHLRVLATLAETDTGANFVNASRNIIGIRHFSRLHPKPGSGDQQIEIRVPGFAPVRPPVLRTGSSIPPGRRGLLPGQLFPANHEPEPWLREPGQPALFITRLGEAALVFSIDEEEVRSAVDRWLRDWLAERFTEIDALDGDDRILGSTRNSLTSANTPDSPPDWVLPVASAFGTVRLESWDSRVTRHSWHTPTLVAAVGGAILALLMGAWLALRVRREHLVAEQRVSFVNRVSHELRTPLTNILLNLDIAADHVTDDQTTRRLSLVREEARRLGRLIENVLSFSRGERDQLDLRARACAPTAVLRKVIEQFTPAFERRAITIRTRIEEVRTCLIDADALAQVAANLLSNVEKYAPGCAADITLRLDGDALVLIVADEGPGIPAHAADRIFRPFERLHSHTSEGVTGTGLGLAIARELAVRMGGTLRLLPSTRGATFELRAPAPAIPELHASSAA